jgi:xanthine dehydrogenase YagR molybdenum-binding subunit
MPYKWPEKRQIIGTKVPRLDGAQKATGKAKYSFDRNLPGLLHGKILRSPHAHCRVLELDLSAAEKMPGVKASWVVKGPLVKDAQGKVLNELHYQGDEICALAAETEEQARDAIRAIKAKYEVLPHVANELQGLPNSKPGAEQAAGNVEDALKNSAAVVEGFYGCHVITHVCWESHGLVAHWKADDELLVYASTQAVVGTASALKQRFGANVKVTCETPYMGGGFGSKFGPDIQGFIAAELAKKAKRPVKLMLERDEEHMAGGNRPSAFAKVKAGAGADGKFAAFDAEDYGSGGNSSDGNFPLPYVWAPAARRRRHTDVYVNSGNKRALRAPGHPQGSTVTDQVMDDLAVKLGKDPVEFRLANLPTGGAFTVISPIYKTELELGAKRIGWKEKYHPPGDKTPGPIKRGLGCAVNTWGGAAGGAQANCVVAADGSVEVSIGSQDLGTGTATLVPLVAAEILGLQISDVKGRIGVSTYPPAGGSGGSTSCGGVSLAVAVACYKALEELYKKVAPQLGAQPADLEAEDGKISVKGGGKSIGWKQACALIGQQPISVNANKDEGAGMSAAGVGGAQFAEVAVDVETGLVRLVKVVAVADCGLVMNRLLCESQVYGGVIGGINAALFEERRLDPKTGLWLNPDCEWYKLAGHSDLPEIDVQLLDYPERGVIGIGEPPYIPTAAAIANAVANAIGVRVGVTPITPRRVLDALAKAGK